MAAQEGRRSLLTKDGREMDVPCPLPLATTHTLKSGLQHLLVGLEGPSPKCNYIWGGKIFLYQYCFWEYGIATEMENQHDQRGKEEEVEVEEQW